MPSLVKSLGVTQGALRTEPDTTDSGAQPIKCNRMYSAHAIDFLYALLDGLKDSLDILKKQLVCTDDVSISNSSVSRLIH